MINKHNQWARVRSQPISSAGFTLIEVMIVVAIIGILAAIAFPSYQESVRKARRADAQTGLLELAQFMDRDYTKNGRYLIATDVAAANLLLPFTEAPKEGASKYYDLSFTALPTANAYTLQATPKGAMTADICGTLTLTNTGAKGQAAGQTLAVCWRR